MADWSTLLTSVLGGGGVWGAGTLVQAWREDRRHRGEEQRAEAAEEREEEAEPLKRQVLQLGVVDQVAAIQQRMIDNLRRDLEETQLRFDAYKVDAERQFEAYKSRAEEQLRRAQDRIREQGEQIHELNATIAQMEIRQRRQTGT